jgi:kynurenine formamidase
VDIRAGDAVLVRSGWTKHFNDREAYLGDRTGAPGPDAAAVQWLIERGVRVTGGDTIAYEVRVPGRNEAPGHGLLLVDAGVPIIEVMDLEVLGRDRVYHFVFVVSPLKLVGATGSPVRPIAIA